MKTESAETLHAIERLHRNRDTGTAIDAYLDSLIDTWRAAVTVEDDKAAAVAGRDLAAIERFRNWLSNKAAEAKRYAA